MSFDAWLTLGIVIGAFVALARNWAPPDLLFVAAAVLLAATGVISTDEAFAGFSNSGMLTVACLFIVVAGMRETGVLDYIGHHVLGSAKTERGALLRLGGVVMPMSAFLNNTPIVAMFLPVVMDWCRRHRVSPSKLLIPLSFLTILGGTCTLIGTSTNLVVNGLMIDSKMRSMGLFEVGKVGVPYAIVGFIYLLVAGRWLLPDRKELIEQLGETKREYLVEMVVRPGCRLIGFSVEAAGLRQLPGLFLIQIDRDGLAIGPVGPEERIEQHDKLIFTGVVSSIIELEKIPGLEPVAHANEPANVVAPQQRRLVEAVISESCPLIGKTIREADFRAVYGAAVVAVHRAGKRLEMKIGDISLRSGDTLLMQTGPHFTRAYRHDPAFYLVSDVEDWRPIRRDRAQIALVIFVALLVAMTTGVIPILLSCALAAVLMIASGCLSTGEARRSIEWQVLITIAASFGVGAALKNSGLATAMATSLVDSTAVWGPVAALAVFYLLGSVMTELITNNAVAVLLFPFCLETARLYGVNPEPFLLALILSASASFMTPIGYQTNMMVYGPGGYRFMDFMKIGAPLNFILWLIAIPLIPLFWPF
jgi:di/tricarboxylate transporter